jgi:hypothetical protein
MMAVQTKDLWSLVQSGPPQVDPEELAAAVEDQAGRRPLDYRTRLLIRDSVTALKKHWGEARLADWLADSPVREQIEAICREPFAGSGFSSLAERIVEKTGPETIRQFLRELSLQLSRPTRLNVGGSGALILQGRPSRSTEVVDIVDEVPAEIRSLHELLHRLKERYGLSIAHFQSHYLPAGWEQRVHSLEPLGGLQVFVVDVYDIFLSKLFSAREKDRDDLRMLAPGLDRDTLIRHYKDTTATLRADPTLLKQATDNWYILFGEPLPS